MDLLLSPRLPTAQEGSSGGARRPFRWHKEVGVLGRLTASQPEGGRNLGQPGGLPKREEARILDGFGDLPRHGEVRVLDGLTASQGTGRPGFLVVSGLL